MMADTPKTPAPPRRKASTGARKTTRSTPPKAPSAANSATTPAVKPVKRATKAPARKPAAPKSSTTKATTAVKSAAAKVGTKAASARQTVAQSTPAQFVAETRESMGDRNFFAALIGGAAAIGAAIGGIFYALRDGNPDGPAGKPPKA